MARRRRAQDSGHSVNGTTSAPQDSAKLGEAGVPDHKLSKSKEKKSRGTKRQQQQGQEEKAEEPTQTQSAAAKRAKASAPAAKQKRAGPANPKVSALLSKYGALPLEQSLPDATSLTPKTLLALLLNAILSSARISHGLAAKSLACLVEADYHDIQVLKKASWDEKTVVLTKGGYRRYREKTATMLGELADLVLEKYDGDLNNLLKQNNSEPARIRAALKEMKGLGDVGVDIFFDTAQGVWPCLAPFVDPRSMKTVDKLRLGTVDELWRAVGEDPMEMCRLTWALTTVRLEKKENEFS